MWLKCDSSAAAPRTLTSRSERTCSVLGHTVQNNVNTSQSVSCKDFYGCSCAWASGGSPIESRACACVNTQPRDMSLDHALMEVSGNQHAKGISKAYRQLCVFGRWGIIARHGHAGHRRHPGHWRHPGHRWHAGHGGHRAPAGICLRRKHARPERHHKLWT